MEALQDTISTLVGRLVGAQADLGARAYPNVRRLMLDNLGSNEFRSAVVRRFSGVSVDQSSLANMTGSRLLVDVFSEYVLEKLDTFANPQSKSFGEVPTFKRSDAADMVHLVYCPYVDVFGCDNAMRDRIKRAGWPVTNVVTSDAELEARINVR